MSVFEPKERKEYIKNVLDMLNVLLGKLDGIGCHFGYMWFTYITNKETSEGQVVQFPAAEFKTKMVQLAGIAETSDFEEVYIAIHLEREGVEDDLCISLANRFLIEAPMVNIFMNNHKLRLLVSYEEYERAQKGAPMYSLPVTHTDYVGYVDTIPHLIHPHIQKPGESMTTYTVKHPNDIVTSSADSLLGLARGIQ